MSCLVAAQAVLLDHHLLGKGLASLHRKEVLIVDLQNIVNGEEQLLKGLSNEHLAKDKLEGSPVSSAIAMHWCCH